MLHVAHWLANDLKDLVAVWLMRRGSPYGVMTCDMIVTFYHSNHGVYHGHDSMRI